MPDDLKRKHLLIPCKKINGFHNILVHNYSGEIDPQTVYQVVERHPPPLEKSIQAMSADGASSP